MIFESLGNHLWRFGFYDRIKHCIVFDLSDAFGRNFLSWLTPRQFLLQCLCASPCQTTHSFYILSSTSFLSSTGFAIHSAIPAAGAKYNTKNFFTEALYLFSRLISYWRAVWTSLANKIESDMSGVHDHKFWAFWPTPPLGLVVLQPQH